MNITLTKIIAILSVVLIWIVVCVYFYAFTVETKYRSQLTLFILLSGVLGVLSGTSFPPLHRGSDLYTYQRIIRAAFGVSVGFFIASCAMVKSLVDKLVIHGWWVWTAFSLSLSSLLLSSLGISEIDQRIRLGFGKTYPSYTLHNPVIFA